MIPVPTLGRTRRNIRVLLALGSSLAVLVGGLGALIFVLGYSRPDVTLTFRELGGYLLALCLLNLVIYIGLYWQVSRLSRRPGQRRNRPQVPQTSAD